MQLGRILNGIKVLDITQNVAGPFCTQILGDMGAEIIKIERPGVGDDTRGWCPPRVGTASATFLALNRNKRSLAVDLSTDEGQQIVLDLAATCDVVIHAMRPGSAASRCLEYDEIRRCNNDVIYCAISGFGEVGPLKDLPGYDPLLQAFSGIMSVTGAEGQDPVRVSVSLVDMGTGLWAALGIVSALLARERGDGGARLSVSLLETSLSWMSIIAAGYFATGEPPRKLGSAMAMAAPYELFRTADGHVFIGAGNDRLFEKVCLALGAEELTTDQRFVTNPERVKNRTELHESIERITSTRSTADLVAACRRRGAPCSELNDVSAVLSHPQVDALDILVNVPEGDAPEHRAIATPIVVDGARGAPCNPPPALGEHSHDVLTELGYDSARIQELTQAGILGQTPRAR